MGAWRSYVLEVRRGGQGRQRAAVPARGHRGRTDQAGRRRLVARSASGDPLDALRHRPDGRHAVSVADAVRLHSTGAPRPVRRGVGARRDARGRVRTPRPPHPRREDNSRSDDQVAERVAWTAASGERSPTTTSCRPGVRRGRATLKPRERGSELPPITRIAPALGRSGRRCAGEPASMMWCGGWVTTRPDRDPSGGPTGLPTRPATTSHAIDSAPHLAVWSTAVNARPDRPTTAPTGMLLPVRSSG